MSENICIACRRPKSSVSCGICQEPLCKDCAQFLDASTFSFLAKLPQDLTHSHYCANCYDEKVAPALESYQETMERAREVYFFFNTQKRPVELLRRSKDAIRVESCEDRDETILRMGFLAVQQGYNAVVEAEVIPQKLRNAGYQKTQWKGVGYPAEVDTERLERRSRRE